GGAPVSLDVHLRFDPTTENAFFRLPAGSPRTTNGEPAAHYVSYLNGARWGQPPAADGIGALGCPVWQGEVTRPAALHCLPRPDDPRTETIFGEVLTTRGRLDHPHLARLFTWGSNEQHWFYTTDLPEGPRLAAVTARLGARAGRGPVDL